MYGKSKHVTFLQHVNNYVNSLECYGFCNKFIQLFAFALQFHVMAAASKKTASVKTRAETHVWLVGQQLAELDLLSCSSRLPTVGQTMRRLFYDLKTKKLSLSQSCSNAVDEVLYLWYISNTPTTQKRNAVSKLTALYKKHVDLCRNKTRRTDRQLELESEFCELMEKVFDVAHADCDKEKSVIEIAKDRIFLEDQRVPRKMKPCTLLLQPLKLQV